MPPMVEVLPRDVYNAELLAQVHPPDWRPPTPRYTTGVFAKYAALVSSASKGAVTVAPETPVTGAARVLLERKIGCLPVRDGEAIVGIFTTSDALDALLSALE